MQFSLNHSLDILQRTPEVLYAMLGNVSPDWSTPNEGGETWSAYDIVGHLIHGEKTDWIPRLEIILSDGPDKKFEPFNRFAQFDTKDEASLEELLEQFKKLRKKNLAFLLSKSLSDDDLQRKGIHPVFGEVTLSELLSTWTVHDLNHIAQISRVMAKQYKDSVGPWTPFLRILQT